MGSSSSKRSAKFFLFLAFLFVTVSVGVLAAPSPVHAVDIDNWFDDIPWKTFFQQAIFDTITVPLWNEIETDNDQNKLEYIALWAPKELLYYISAFLVLLINIAGELFEASINPANLTVPLNSPSVYAAWAYVRDFFNILFIFLLLISAFSTIFQIEKFHYKKILLNVILMALLVNFSWPISRAVIDLANIPMYYFYSQAAALSQFASTDSTTREILPFDHQAPSITAYLMGIVILSVLAITILNLAILMFVRLMMLIVLVIFSPIGFVGATAPFASDFGKKWWGALFNYSFFGSTITFFLGLFGAFVGELSATIQAQSSQVIDLILRVGIPVALLWMAMTWGKQAGIMGADAAMKWSTKAFKWATLLPAAFIGRRLERGIGHLSQQKGWGWTRYLSPTIVKKAWKENQEELDRKAFREATGKARRGLQYLTHPYKTIKGLFTKDFPHVGDHAFEAMEAEAAVYEKALANTEANYLIPELESAIAERNQAKTFAILKALDKYNNLNDMMMAIGETYGGTQNADPLTIQNAMNLILTKSGSRGEMLAKQLMSLDQIAEESGNIGFAGGTTYEGGRFHVTKDTSDWAKHAAAKFQNVSVQMRQQKLHHNSLFTEGPDGKLGDMHTIGKAIFEKMDSADIREAHRSRGDLRENILKRYRRLDEEDDKGQYVFKNFRELYHTDKEARQYVNKMVNLAAGDANEDKRYGVDLSGTGGDIK